MMWDFSGGNSGHPYGAYPEPSPERMPTPAFSLPDDMLGRPSSLPGPSYFPSSMPFPTSSAASTGYLTVPDPTMPIPRAMSPHSEHHHHHHHSSSSHRHHRTHSNPTRPKPIIVSATTHHSYSGVQHLAPPIPIAAPPGPHVHHHPPSPSLRPRPLSSSGLDGYFQYSKCTGRKKALCIGINYRGQANELRGCINDARHVRDFLIRQCGYKSKDIVILTDDSPNPRQLPTRKNLLDAMHWLVDGAATNDSLFFHYSGHGGQTRDIDGDELDGWDEVIYPMDFRKRGHIIDDEMHRIMVQPLPTGCRLTALFDSCHSGTVLDLPYIYSSHGRLKGSHVSSKARRRKATSADVISWSGCKDGQTSADTFHGGVAVGAMSFAFISSLTKQPHQSYAELLKSVRTILYPKFSQRPQLGSSHHIDTGLRFIV